MKAEIIFILVAVVFISLAISLFRIEQNIISDCREKYNWYKVQDIPVSEDECSYYLWDSYKPFYE